MKARDAARYGARLEHQRRKLHRLKRDLRGSAPAEVRESLHLAIIQLAGAVEMLDRLAGEELRRELRGG